MRTLAWIGAVTVAAGAAFVAGVAGAPARAAAAYLVAWVFWLTLAVGVLFWVMIAHTTSAVWFVALRRVAERVLVALPALTVLAVPLLLMRAQLFPAPHDAYSRMGAVTARTVVYLAVFCGLGLMLRRESLRQDADAKASHLGRLRKLGSVGLPVAGLSLTFASFDWLMALEDPFESTMYGVYVCAGAALSGLALVAILVHGERRAGRLSEGVGVSHGFVIGKLFLMLVLFWAYIGFSQFLLIWIADLPAESVFYVARARGAWPRAAWVLGVGEFALPFLLLLSWRFKRSFARVAAVAGLLLVAHYVDVFWLVLPSLDRSGPHLHWLDVAALVAVGGASAFYVVLRTRRDASVPLHDPRLEESLSFENA